MPVVVVDGLARRRRRLRRAGRSSLLVGAGILLWTLTEYWLHRLVFHWEPDHADRPPHALHHPRGPPRPPERPAAPGDAAGASAIPLAALFLGAFSLIFGTPAAYPLFAGFIVGYLLYDYTHYTCTITRRGPSSASGCASSTCATTSRTTATATASHRRSGTWSSAPCRASGAGSTPSRATHSHYTRIHTDTYCLLGGVTMTSANGKEPHMPSTSSAVDQAASILKARIDDLHAELPSCSALSPTSRTAAQGRRGPGRPRDSGAAAAPRRRRTPRRHPRRPGGQADQGEPRHHRVGDREEDEDQAELPLPGARRPREGGQGAQEGPAATYTRRRSRPLRR